MISEDAVRKFVAGLPETDEHPHFERLALRVDGKIFGSMLLGERDLNLRLTDEIVEATVNEDAAAFRMVKWGKQRNWLKVDLKAAPADRVRDLIEDAWTERAPKRLL